MSTGERIRKAGGGDKSSSPSSSREHITSPNTFPVETRSANHSDTLLPSLASESSSPIIGDAFVSSHKDTLLFSSNNNNDEREQQPESNNSVQPQQNSTSASSGLVGASAGMRQDSLATRSSGDLSYGSSNVSPGCLDSFSSSMSREVHHDRRGIEDDDGEPAPSGDRQGRRGAGRQQQRLPHQRSATASEASSFATVTNFAAVVENRSRNTHAMSSECYLSASSDSKSKVSRLEEHVSEEESQSASRTDDLNRAAAASAGNDVKATEKEEGGEVGTPTSPRQQQPKQGSRGHPSSSQAAAHHPQEPENVNSQQQQQPSASTDEGFKSLERTAEASAAAVRLRQQQQQQEQEQERQQRFAPAHAADRFNPTNQQQQRHRRRGDGGEEMPTGAAAGGGGIAAAASSSLYAANNSGRSHHQQQQQPEPGTLTSDDFRGQDLRTVVDLANTTQGSEPKFGDQFRQETSFFDNFRRAIKPWEMLLAFFILAAIPAIAVVSVDQMRRARVNEARDKTQAALQKTMSRIGNDFSRVAAITRSFATLFFGAVNASVQPDHTAMPISARQIEFANEKFVEYCKEEMKFSPSVVSFSTRPANILTQIYPPGTSPYGLNMNDFVAAEIAAANTVSGGYISGPRMLFQGYPGLVTYWPIWLRATDPQSPLAIPAEYWGTVGIVVNLTRFVEDLQIPATVRNITQSADAVSDVQYAMHMQNEYTGNNTWFGSKSIGAAYEANIDDARDNVQTASTSLYGVQSTVYVDPDLAFLNAVEIVVGILILLVLLGIFLVIARLLTLARIKNWRTKNCDNAPPSGQVCMMICSIADASHYWDHQDPEKMTVTLSLYAAIIRAVIADFQGYEVSTEGHSFLIACTDIARATKMSIAIHEAMAETTAWPLRLHNKTVGLMNRVAIVVGRAHAITDSVTGFPVYQGFAVDQVRQIEKYCRSGCTIMRADQFERVPESLQEWYNHVDESAWVDDLAIRRKLRHRMRRCRLVGERLPVELSQFVLAGHMNSIVPIYGGEDEDEEENSSAAEGDEASPAVLDSLIEMSSLNSSTPRDGRRGYDSSRSDGVGSPGATTRSRKRRGRSTNMRLLSGDLDDDAHNISSSSVASMSMSGASSSIASDAEAFAIRHGLYEQDQEMTTTFSSPGIPGHGAGAGAGGGGGRHIIGGGANAQQLQQQQQTEQQQQRRAQQRGNSRVDPSTDFSSGGLLSGPAAAAAGRGGGRRREASNVQRGGRGNSAAAPVPRSEQDVANAIDARDAAFEKFIQQSSGKYAVILNDSVDEAKHHQRLLERQQHHHRTGDEDDDGAAGAGNNDDNWSDASSPSAGGGGDKAFVVSFRSAFGSNYGGSSAASDSLLNSPSGSVKDIAALSARRAREQAPSSSAAAAAVAAGGTDSGESFDSPREPH